MNIGFIGLGSMGSTVAGRLIASGHSLTVFNRTADKAESLTNKGATVAESAKALAEMCDVIFICVTGDDALRALMTGDDGALAGAKSGTIFIDVSTDSVTVTRDMEARAKAKGAKWLDAPMLGSPKMAEEGEMPFVVGGSEEALETVRPVLESIGKNITYMGTSGLGQAAKIVHGVACAISLIAYSEALLLGDKMGLSREQTLAVLNNGAVGSKLLTLKTPRYKDDSYTPTNARLANMIKDVSLAYSEGESFGQKMPALKVTKELYDEAKKMGLTDEDTSAVLKVLQ